MANSVLAARLAACLLAGCAVAMVCVSLQATDNSVVLFSSSGMSKSAAQQDLKAYYASLDSDVEQSRAYAKKHLQQEDTMLHHDDSTKTAKSYAHHGLPDATARQRLSSWYDKQQTKLARMDKANSAVRDTKEPAKMSAKAAKDDLDSFFDSLNVHPNKDKRIERLSSEVKDLSKDLKDIVKPVEDLKSSETETQKEVHQLDDVDQHLLADSKSRARATDRAEQAAQKAAQKAAEAAKAKKPDVYVNTVDKVVPNHIPNPKIKMQGLPPGWSAYMDRATKHAYFFNEHSGLSTWINPKGAEAQLKGLPKGWDALKESDGKVYYTNMLTGLSAWNLPKKHASSA